MQNRHPNTGEELMVGFFDSVNELIDEYKEVMKHYKKTKQDSDPEKLHATLRLLQRYFNTRGGLPV